MSVPEKRLLLDRRQCQQWRRYLAGLEALAQRLRADERRLRVDIELAVADPLSPETGAGRPDFAGEFTRELIARHGKLAHSVAAIDTQIAEVGAALGAAEQELKREELAAEQRTARAGSAEPRRTRRASIGVADRQP